MPRIAVINQKGGVGKTTTVANLGVALSRLGRKVLLIDLDPQSHLTLHLGIEPADVAHSIYEVLTELLPLAQAKVAINEHLHLVPAHIDLAAAEMELAGVVGREVILRDQLSRDPAHYDFVLIDCPPSLGLLTVNALAAAEDVFIPLQPHFLALQGLGKLLQTVSLVSQRLNPSLKVAGIVLCMFESNTRLAAEVVEDIQKFLASARGAQTPWSQAVLFETRIRRNIKLAECPSHGKSIFDYEPRSAGAEDYATLAKEVLARYEQPQPGETADETRRDESGIGDRGHEKQRTTPAAPADQRDGPESAGQVPDGADPKAAQPGRELDDDIQQSGMADAQ